MVRGARFPGAPLWCAPRLRSSSQSRYPPMAASNIPPSGRSRIAAPIDSPHAKPDDGTASRLRVRPTHTQADGMPVQRQRGEENLQSLRESGRRIVCQKRTKRREQKRRLRGAFGEQPPRHVGDQEASGQIEQHLHQQDCAEILIPEKREDHRQKGGIPGQTRERRHDHAGVRDAVDAVLQPVFGDVGVEPGVVHHRRKAENQATGAGPAPPGSPTQRTAPASAIRVPARGE